MEDIQLLTLTLPLPAHIDDELARYVLAELDKIMTHGFGELRVEVRHGFVEVIPAPAVRFRYRSAKSGQVGAGMCGGDE